MIADNDLAMLVSCLEVIALCLALLTITGIVVLIKNIRGGGW